MTWRRGEDALTTPELEDLAEAALDRVAAKIDVAAADPDAVRRAEERVRAHLDAAVSETAEKLGISGAPLDRDLLSRALLREIATHGPAATYLADETVTEIMANASGRIFVERNGVLEETRRRYRSDEHLLRVIRMMASVVGRKVDEQTPYVDARLPDGSRVHAIVPPLAPDGPALTIRKFSRSAASMADLVRVGAVPAEIGDFLHACVRGRLNLVVSGGTSSGKTTLLNALAEAAGDGERIITIEDACELNLKKRNLIRLETRPPDLEEKGEITIRTLLRNSLRMRPDRIIVGEVRGAECFDMLQAMNTGHSGSMTTVHANTARDALTRLETCYLVAGIEIPVGAIRRQIAQAVHLLVHLDRMADGKRRVVQITEVYGMEGDVITTQDIFVFAHEKVARPGEVKGELLPTGLVPKCIRDFENKGIRIPAKIFGKGRRTA